MDKRTLRSRKVKSRNARPYDRQNQSIFGKVCSTVKGWFNVSHWISNSEEQHEGPLDNVEDENDNINNNSDVVSQSTSNANKRLRLRLDGRDFQDGPSIQSSETQTWPEQPTQNLYEPIRIVSPPSTAAQSSLLENKEVMAVINGDDHSENSEGSASTSGCSSLVSSHKESNRLGERPFVSLLDVKSNRKRKETSPKPDYNDFNSSRGLWSSRFSPSLKYQRRYPTVSHTNQPNFNLSSFAGPSRLNESSEKKTSSPFYEGKTTFGGASAVRRMPASVAPYQADRSLRNQVRVRDQTSDDNLKRMSSAAERILLTLDKISSPVSDAKRIPNLETSPVDLSVYLTPPKSRWNSQLTPSVASKGPPIANINTIAKLATLKNYGSSRLRSTSQVASTDQNTSSFDFQNASEAISQKSGGGKMKKKLNQHHISSKQGMAEQEMIDVPVLKNIPMPITSLPTISFGPKPDKTMNSHLSASGFTFSKPIEHDLSVGNTVPTSSLAVHSPYDSFKFAHPIDYDLSINTQPKENIPKPTWDCSACWVQNPQNITSCIACETPRDTKENKSTSSIKSPFGSQLPEKTTASTPSTVTFKFGKSDTINEVSSSETQNNHVFSFGSTASNFKFGSSPRETSKENIASISDNGTVKFGSPMNFTFGTKNLNSTPVAQKQTGSASTFENTPKSYFSIAAASTAGSAETWECKECWVKNPSKESKCLACETPQSTKNNETAPSSFATSTSSTISSNSNMANWECNTCWIKNPMNKSKCMACETPKPGGDKNSVPTSFGCSTSSICTNSNIGDWECNTCLIKNPINKSKCMACEAPKPGGDKNSEMNSSTSNTFSTWECTSCWVRNPIKYKKCMACETLHPKTDISSAIKEDSGFKFSSPLQNSPITFKFGNFVCTAASTATTSTFKFGVSVTESQTTTTTSGFKFGTSNAIFASPVVSASVSKASESLPSTTQSFATTGFKMPDVTLASDETQNDKVSNTSEVSQTKTIFPLETKATESVSESKSSCVTKNNAGDAVIKIKESAPEPEKSNSFISNTLHLEESSKEKLPDAVITSSSSNVPSPSVTACFGFTTKPIQSKDTKENKLPVFKVTSESPSLSAFTSPVNLFKFGSEKVDSTKNSLSSTSVTLATTTASFSFSNSGSTFGTITNPKIVAVTSASSNSNPITIKTEENKTVPCTTISTAVTTSIPSVFGSSVTTSTPSGFSFFPTSSVSSSTSSTTATAAATSTSTTSVFTFGASSNQSGGFTFKGLEKPQTTSAVSSTSQSAPTSISSGISTQVPSFQPPAFGASKTEAPPFMSVPPVTFTFGAGATTVPSNTTAFSAFQPPQPGNPSFQFGSQIPGSTASTIGGSTNFVFSKKDAPNPTSSSVSQNTVPAFGSTTSNFVFGAKSENSVPILSSVSQPSGITFGSSSNFTFSNKNDNSDTASQKPSLQFGSATMPVFGNTPVQPSFDGQDKPTTGGFNFGTPSSAVFQFGASSNNADKKRTATASGFSFGTPSASETNASSFPTGFSMNTPPSFNFGAASTPAGPFQFAASGAAAAAKPASTVNSGPRKIRKAVRRVNRGKD